MSNKKTTRIIARPSTSIARTRKNQLAAFHKSYIQEFEEIPEDYEALKQEAVYLGKLSGHAFLLMAQRLKKIKDLSLYKEDGYRSFKEFVDTEMTLERSTVYNYMDILEAFGHESLLAEPELEYTKLRPAVPILKARGAGVPKARIKKQFIAKAKTATRREIAQTAKKLKARYGLSPSRKIRSLPAIGLATAGRASEAGQTTNDAGQVMVDDHDHQMEANIKAFLATIPPGELTDDQKQQLRLLVKELTSIIVRK